MRVEPPELQRELVELVGRAVRRLSSDEELSNDASRDRF